VFLSFHFSKINYFFKSGQWPRYGIKSCWNIQTHKNNIKLYLGKVSASIMAKTSRYNINCKTFGIPLSTIFHIEPTELTKRLKFYELVIICGILHQEYLKMRVKKVNIFKDIKLQNFNSILTFFSIHKNSIFHLFPSEAQFLKIILSGRIKHFKKNNIKGRGFQGGWPRPSSLCL